MTSKPLSLTTIGTRIAGLCASALHGLWQVRNNIRRQFALQDDQDELIKPSAQVLLLAAPSLSNRAAGEWDLGSRNTSSASHDDDRRVRLSELDHETISYLRNYLEALRQTSNIVASANALRRGQPPVEGAMQGRLVDKQKILFALEATEKEIAMRGFRTRYPGSIPLMYGFTIDEALRKGLIERRVDGEQIVLYQPGVRRHLDRATTPPVGSGRASASTSGCKVLAFERRKQRKA